MSDLPAWFTEMKFRIILNEQEPKTTVVLVWDYRNPDYEPFYRALIDKLGEPAETGHIIEHPGIGFLLWHHQQVPDIFRTIAASQAQGHEELMAVYEAQRIIDQNMTGWPVDGE